MQDDPRRAPAREIRFEGPMLVLGCAVLGLALVVAFLAGRWVERGGTQPQQPGEGSRTAAPAQEPPVDVSESMDHFDRADAPGTRSAPQRQVPRASPPSSPTQATAAPPDAPGAFYVQVWAGRDRATAEQLVSTLGEEGFTVRLVSDRTQGDDLFKVRVGGYPTEAEARSAAESLQGRGYRGAWVTSGS